MNIGSDLLKKFSKSFTQQVNLSNYSWFNLGGNAEFFFKPSNKDQLIEFLAEVKKNNLPYINIYTNKCYGGISASFCGVSDIAFAEKSTMIGFAGQHIVKNQTKEELPENCQSSQELMRTGFLDAEFHRKEINDKIMTVLKILLKKNSVINSEQNETSENSQSLTREAS